MKVLQGRNVYVFPDLSKDGNTFKEWKQKAIEFQKQLKATTFVFSDLLEQLAPERDKSNGNDIADYLIQHDWKKFRKQPPPPEIENSEVSEASEDEKKHFILNETQIEKIPKGKPFFYYELIEKFRLSESTINTHFQDCFAGSLWIPVK